jgi:putative intracellular protease/amidase
VRLEVFDAPGTCPDCGMALVEQGSAAAAPRADTRRTVAILLFNGVEIIDSTGPYELFGAANYNVYTVGETREPVTTAMGMTVVPKYSFADAPRADVLVVPGGGVRGAQQNAALLRYVVDATATARHTMSVCNGSFILASAGLLDGLTATSTYGNVLRLHAEFPKVKVVGDRRYVDNGKIITHGGTLGRHGRRAARHLAAGRRGARAGGGAERGVRLASDRRLRAPGDGGSVPPQHRRGEGLGAQADWKVVSSTGDADHWDIVVQGPSKHGGASCCGSLGQALEQQARWTATASSAPRGAATRGSSPSRIVVVRGSRRPVVARHALGGAGQGCQRDVHRAARGEPGLDSGLTHVEVSTAPTEKSCIDPSNRDAISSAYAAQWPPVPARAFPGRVTDGG